MNNREQYDPGPANMARVEKDGEKWTLVLVRELRHSPEKVWQAITDTETRVKRADAPKALVAHLSRCAGSPSRRSTHWTHRRPRGDEVRRLAATERRVREAVRR